MKNTLKKTLTVIVLFSSFSFSFADSNNGYTTAANVYSGSSSRTWFGAGVAHVLAEWKKERAMPEITPVEPAVEEQPSSDAESTSN
jgi:hypothetical protein